MTPDQITDMTKFRQEVADFLDHNVPDIVWEAVTKTTAYFPPYEAMMTMHRLLASKGWSVVNWPKEYGGPGWSEVKRHIFFEEYCRRGLPMLAPQSVGMVAPAIMQFGTDAQKAKYLPAIASGEHTWCQGYSEPNAGSDLVSLQCKAVSDGDDYLVTGQKIWTTWAHEVNHMFMLVRTSNQGKPQQGITFLLLDSMELPGMRVVPIKGLDGFPEQAEVFFDNVRVPKSQILGQENDGWTVAKYLLEHERSGGGTFQFVLRRELDMLHQLATELPDGQGGKLSQDKVFQTQLAELEVDLACVSACENKIRQMGPHHPDIASMASIVKLEAMDLTQKITELALQACGSQALPNQQAALHVGGNQSPIGSATVMPVMAKYLNQRAASIFGGSHQIQRDILAKILFAK